MKILLIEDEASKRAAISGHVKDILGVEARVVERESLRSGLKEVISDEKYDLILLDMSMPGFDVSSEEPIGGEPESFAGQEIMAQMKLRKINTPVAVVTQYKAFAKGTVGLDELVKRFEEDYKDFFVGAIYYSAAVESWKKEIAEIIGKHKP